MKLKLNSNDREEVRGMTIEYPYVLHRDTYEANEDVPWHWHEELEINYVVSGEVELSITDNTYVLKEGEACFVNSNVISKYVYPKESHMMTHFFHSVFLSGHYKSIFETKYVEPIIQNKKVKVVIIKGETKEQKELLEKIRELGSLQNLENVEFQTRNKITEIWLLLMEVIKNRQEEQSQVPSIARERLFSMMQFIHQNYADKITLEDIANSATISSRECLRCFNLCLRETPIEYLTNYRINMAKELLKHSNKSVTDIALDVGFSNAAYFTKVFKQVRQITPKEYRKLYLTT